MDEKLLMELRSKFEEMKKELKFKATYEEIESHFFIEDYVADLGFVSTRLSRQIANRIIEGPYSWMSTLHAWVFPPQDLISMNEVKAISSEEKKEIMHIMGRIMTFFRKSKKIGFEKARKDEGEFIDEMLQFKVKEFDPFMIKYLKKFENFWKAENK